MEPIASQRHGSAGSITAAELAERWLRRPQWITMSARQGSIPGAWKLGQLWRLSLSGIESYERSLQVKNIFTLTKGSVARQRRQN